MAYDIVSVSFCYVLFSGVQRVIRRWKLTDCSKSPAIDLMAIDPDRIRLATITAGDYNKCPSTRKSSSRGKHFFPLICDALRSDVVWIHQTEINQYRYPGFNHEWNKLLFIQDYTKLRLAAKNDPHFVYSDIELAKGSSSLTHHDVDINGTKTKISIRRAPCEGVKVCTGENCTYAVQNHQRLNR